MGRRKIRRWSIKSLLTCLLLVTLGALSAVGAFAMLYFGPQLETELAFYATELSKPASTRPHQHSPTRTPEDPPRLLLADERQESTPTPFQPLMSTSATEATKATTTLTLTGTITSTSTVSATILSTTTFTTSPQTEITPSKTPSKTLVPYKTPTRTPTKTRVPSSTATSKPQPTKTKTQTPTPQSSPTRTHTASPPPPPSTSQTPTLTSTQPATTSTPTEMIPSVTPTSGSTCNTSGNSGFESTLIDLINEERADQGLDPLTRKSALTAAARVHSEDMACNDFLSHTGSDGSRPADRVAAQGYSFTWIGENIYAGNGSYNSPNQAFNWWMNSAPHRANLLNSNYKSIGIGYIFSADSQYGGYFTAVFARP